MDGFRRPEHEDTIAELVREMYDGEAESAIRNPAHLLTLLQVYSRSKPGGEFVETIDSTADIAALDIESHPLCAVVDSLDFYYRITLDYDVQGDASGLLRIQYAADPTMLNRLVVGSLLPEDFRRGRFFGYPMSAIVAHFSGSLHWQEYVELFPALVDEGLATPDELAIQRTYAMFVPELTPEGIREAVDVAFNQRAQVRRFIEVSGLTMAHEILDKLEDDAMDDVQESIQNQSEQS